MDLVRCRSLLESLQDYGRTAGSSEDALDVWHTITELVKNACDTDQDRAVAASILLDDDTGALKFCRSSIKHQDKDGSKARQEVWIWLSEFLDSLPPDAVAAHAASLMSGALRCFKVEPAAGPRQAALSCLQTLLELRRPEAAPVAADAAQGEAPTADPQLKELARELQNQYVRNKTLTATVQGELLQTLGLLLELGGEVFASDGQFNAAWLLSEGQGVLRGPKAKDAARAGAIAGMSSALFLTEDPQPVVCQRLYAHLLEVTAPAAVSKMSRYNKLKAALRMLALNAPRFGSNMVNDVAVLFESLYALKGHGNKSVREAADLALASLMQQVAIELCKDDTSVGPAVDRAGLHKRLLGDLTSIVSDRKASGRDVATAVRGIGQLAAPTLKFFGQEGLRNMLARLAPLVQQRALLQQVSDLQSDAIGNEVALLQALASLAGLLDEVDAACLQLCSQVMEGIVDAYVSLWAKQRPGVHTALATLLSALASKAAVLQDMLQRLVTVLLAATLAEPNPDEAFGPAAVSEESAAPWRTYVHLWQALLPTAAKEGEQWQRGLYDALLQAVISAVDNLDLSYHPAYRQGQGQLGDEPEVLAVGDGLEAANIIDMRVFLNLRGFVTALLPSVGAAAFRPWAQTFLLRMVAASGRLPQLSGFYHIICTSMQLAESAGLLDDQQIHHGDVTDGTQVMAMLSTFLHDLLPASRQFSDELLAAALELLLSAPVSLLPPQDVLTALQKALTVGLQYEPLAGIAVAALERWERQRPQVLQQLAPGILPLLEPYLVETPELEAAPDVLDQGISGDGDGAEDVVEEEVVEAKSEAAKDARSIQRGAAAAARRAQQRRQEGLRVLRPRILAFLGRSGAAVEALVRSAALSMQTSGPAAAAAAAGGRSPDALLQWDLHRRAGLALPFGDIGRLQLWLDPLLPQVAAMAERGTDRAARVAACEFLHASTLWMVGTNAKAAAPVGKEDFDSAPTRFYKLLRKMFPVILRLAVSQEKVARQLFSDLAVSLVHWLTASARREAAEPMALLDAIIDGLVDDSDGGLRQFCAKLAREWLIWSGKHISGPRGAALNASSLLRRLFDRLQHPNAYQRLGAAMAMEQVADPLGRQHELAETYMLEALSGCVHALQLAEEDTNGSHTRQQIAAALVALTKVLNSKPKLLEALKHPKPSRQQSDLPSFMVQLWPKTVAPHHFCRRNVTWLLTQLAHLMLEEDSPEQSVAKWVREQGQATGAGFEAFLALPPEVQLPAAGLAAPGAVQWLKHLEAHLAWARWVLEHGILMPAAFAPPAASAAASGQAAGMPVVEALPGFFEAVHRSSQADSSGHACIMPGAERALRHVVLAAVEFQQQVLGELLVLPELPAVQHFIELAALAPQRLGFDPSETSTYRTLPATLRRLLERAASQQPALLRHLSAHLARLVDDRGSSMGSLLGSAGADLETTSSAVATLLQGLTLLAELRGTDGKVLQLLPSSLAAELPNKLLVLAAHLPPSAGPQQREAAEAGLKLALRLDLAASSLLTALQDPKYGDTLCANFRAVLHSWVIWTAASCCGPLCRALGDVSSPAHRVSEVLMSGTLEALHREQAKTGRPDIRLGSFLQALLPQLQQLAPLVTGLKTGKDLLLRLLGRLLALSARTVLSPTQPAFAFVLDSYVALLGTKGNATTDAQIRCQALALLPFFLEHGAADHQKRVLAGVEGLVSGCFPLSSWELPRGSTQAADYAAQLAAAFGALAQAAERGANATALLEELQPVLMEMGEAKGHTRQASLAALLARVAAAPWTGIPSEASSVEGEASPDSRQGEAFASASRRADSLLSYAWLYVFTDAASPEALRRAMLAYVLLPMLRMAPRRYRRTVFEDKAPFLRDVLDYAPTLPQSLRNQEAPALIARIAAYQLFQIMYQTLPPPDVKAIVAHITNNAAVMKPSSHDTKSFNVPPHASGSVKSLAREVRCAAFATMAALVVATQGKLQFYKKVLLDAGDLTDLLDPDMKLRFGEETEGGESAAKRAASSMRATLEAVKARRAAAGATATMGFSTSFSMGVSLSDKLSASQYSLSDGGLEGETLGMEQGNSVAAKHQTTLDLAAAPVGNVHDELEDVEAPEGAADDVLLTEDDALDQHPAMLPAVQLVERAAALWLEGGGPAQAGGVMPDFLDAIHQKLSTSATPHASRLFLVKVILHVDQRHIVRKEQKPPEERMVSVFGRFGSKFFGPMIDAIIGDSTDPAQDGMHYVLVDAICAAANWGDTVLMRMSSKTPNARLPGELEPAARLLLDYVARAAYSPSTQVVNNTFQLVKLLLQSWRYAVPLPAPAILAHLQAPLAAAGGLQQRAAGRNQRMVGMKLLSVGLRYGQAPALLTCPEAQQILDAVASCLDVKGGTRLAAATGECLGYLLEMLARLAKAPPPGPVPDAGGMLERLSEQARRRLAAVAQNDLSKFLHAVERTSATYPLIVDLLEAPLLHALPRVPGQLATLLLETLARHAARMPEPLQLLSTLQNALKRLLEAPNPAVHAALLSLLSQLLPKEPDAAAGPILQKLLDAKLGNSGSTAVRRGLADVLRAAWEGRPELRDSLLRAPLLALLGDPDGAIRLDAQRWWHAVLPEELPARLQALLTPVPSSSLALRRQLERQWSTAAALLMMRLPRNDRDAEAAIFSSGLAECSFQDYSIDTGQQSTLQLAPMFSATWSASQSASQAATQSQLVGPGGNLVSRTQVGPGMVRATQGSLSQTYSFSLAPPMESQFVAGSTQASAAARGSTQGAAIASQAASQPASLTVRRRLSKADSQRAGILANMRRKQAASSASMLARHRKVTLLRSYRTGELPDIEKLTLSSFLDPLSAMAGRDGGVARLVLQGLWSSAVDELDAQVGGSAGTRRRKDAPTELQLLRTSLSNAFAAGPREPLFVQTLQACALADRASHVDPELMAAAAHYANSLQAGVLQIEQQIIAGLDDSSSVPPAKSRRTSVSGAATGKLRGTPAAWAAAAALYSELGEDNLMQTAFAQHVAKCPGTRAAMRLFRDGHLNAAFIAYERLLRAAGFLEDDGTADMDEGDGAVPADPAALLGGAAPSAEEERLWQTERLRALEALGDWRQVLSVVNSDLVPEDDAEAAGMQEEEAAPDDSRLFGDMPQLLRPFVRACLFSGPADAEQAEQRARLAQLLQSAATDAARRDALRAAAPVEVAAHAALLHDWVGASASVGDGWGVFRDKWAALHPLSYVRRRSTLEILQPLAEIQEAAALVPAQQSSPVPEPALRQLSAVWKARWPSADAASPDAALTVHHVRCILLEALQLRIGSQVAAELTSDLTLAATSHMRGAGHLDLAADLLSRHSQRSSAKDAELLIARASLRIDQLGAVCGSADAKRTAALVRGELGRLEAARISAVDVGQARTLLLLQGRAHSQLATHGTSPTEHLPAALHCFQEAAGDSSSAAEAAEIAQASLQLALLVDEVLQEAEASASSAAASQVDAAAAKRLGLPAGSSPAALLVEHLLRSIHAGGDAGAQAQLFVPRLLDALAGGDAPRNAFAERWRGVSLDAFLPWVPIMLSLLGEQQGNALLPALQALAAAHPQRLYFPFHLSRAHYGVDGQKRAEALAPLLRSPLLEAFAAALNDTTYPGQRWDGWAQQLLRLVQDSKQGEVAKLFKNDVYPDIIGRHERSRARSEGGASASATINAVVAQKHGRAVREVFGADGAQLRSMSASEFRKASLKIGQALKAETHGQTGRRDIAQLSPWFEAFSSPTAALPGAEELLMPAMPSIGSTAGAGSELPVTIVGFGKAVHVFSSKQAPKKITIYGSDFASHDWVLKGGEEVRTDQRVEQLFDVMNGLLRRSPAATATGLQVATYDVVPITPALGMLAFVGGTRPLIDVFSPELVDANGKANDDFVNTVHKLARAAPGDAPAAVYERLFSARREDVVRGLEAVQAQVREDALREALLRSAAGPEAFLAMRANFTSSLAAVCASNYVAGVGDRHLQNFLLHERTATIVPIDFGYAFGTATQALPVPELMPFRLTRQMAGALAPHDATAVLQRPLALGMGALRDGRAILQGVLGIFLREPLADWQREARLLQAGADGENEYISLKVEFAKRRLTGAHPAELTVAELETRHKHKRHWPALQTVVRGRAGSEARVGVPADAPLNVDAQVTCLLDQATDPNILGRTWWGWRPWL